MYTVIDRELLLGKVCTASGNFNWEYDLYLGYLGIHMWAENHSDNQRLACLKP